MNKKQSQTIMAADFIGVLRERQKTGPSSPLTVEGTLTISREECKDFKSLSIDEVTFTDQVMIKGFHHDPLFLISTRASRFLGGLVFEHNSGHRIDFLGGEVSSLYFLDKNQFDVACFCGFMVENRLALSGLQLRENLRMENTGFSKLELCCCRTSHHITVPWVITNNSWARNEFHLAMIPVFTL